MNLKEKIQADFMGAFKGKDAVRLDVLKMLRAELHNAEIKKMGPLNDEEIIDVISREIKKRKKAIELYERGGRKDLADKEKTEIEILLTYET